MSFFQGKRIVIAGGSGFLGISLAQHLTKLGASLIILSRSVPKVAGAWTHVPWDGRTLGAWAETLNGCNGLVNLAGRSVDCIKTADHKDEILRSRVDSTRVLGAAMRAIESPPSVWVQMSTAHIYGDPPTAVCTEGSATGYGLAPFVAKAWESAFESARMPAQRGVILRTSFVIGRNQGAGGGAMDTLAKIARWGLGGRVGHGRQGMSWIHEVDMNRIIARSLEHEQMKGIYIASAPKPVSQVDFMRELRAAAGMPIGLPAPAWLVRIGAHLLLRTDPELAIYGRYVRPARLEEEGFEFEIPRLSDALNKTISPHRA